MTQDDFPLDPEVISALTIALKDKGIPEIGRLIYKDHFGCFKREYLLEIYKKNRHLIESGNFSVMITDADKFKRINDDFGHIAGDLAIQEMFSRAMGEIEKIKSKHNEIDYVIARLGGDEGIVNGFDISEGKYEHMLRDFEKILLAKSSYTIEPDLMLDDQGRKFSAKIPVLISGGYVDARDNLHLIEEVFLDKDFRDSINSCLKGPLKDMSKTQREVILSKELSSYNVDERTSFDFTSIGLENHIGSSLVNYLLKEGVEELTTQDITDSETVNYLSLFMVAMQSEADFRLYQAKKIGGGFCYGEGKIKEIQINRDTLDRKLIEVPQEAVRARIETYERTRDKRIR